jgi:RecB family endonuclease NucS
MKVVAPRIHARQNGHSMEVDVLAYSHDRDEVFLVEVKSHLREDALDQMRRMLREFHEFFPDHEGKKVCGILAAVDAPEDIRKKVLDEGIYLARVHDGHFELQVPENFQPRAF